MIDAFVNNEDASKTSWNHQPADLLIKTPENRYTKNPKKTDGFSANSALF